MYNTNNNNICNNNFLVEQNFQFKFILNFIKTK